MIYSLDTNIVTLLLKEDNDVKRNADIALESGHSFVIPKIVDYEVRRGLLAKNMNKKLAQYLAFRQSVLIGTIDDYAWDKATEIYAELIKKGKPCGDDGDILIAAFCIVNGYILVTNNTKHFENISELQTLNWKSG